MNVRDMVKLTSPRDLDGGLFSIFRWEKSKNLVFWSFFFLSKIGKKY